MLTTTNRLTLAIDPLWQCLCPSSSSSAYNAFRPLRALRASHASFSPSQRPALHCLNEPQPRVQPPRLCRHRRPILQVSQRRAVTFTSKSNLFPSDVNPWDKYETPYLYSHLRALAISAKVRQCRELVEYMISVRGEQPSAQLYTALILSNISHDQGAAWRVGELLDEMREVGIPMDVGVCHAVLKVLAVHPDHLLGSDVLEYMGTRWLAVSEEGAHDVAAGLLREGLIEQGLARIDVMRKEGFRVETWLLDMAVYVLCAAGEVEEAHRIVRQRYDSGELTISRAIWSTLIDCGSIHRHHASTALTWNSQVNTGYIQLPSGTCLNVLTTAAQAGDAVLATDVFTHLSKRGTRLRAIHYQQMVDCYLSTDPPDLQRAISILPIMTIEKLEPSASETRSLFQILKSQPALLPEALETLRDLHQRGRKIPIAALNLLIECHVERRDLAEAMKVYKLIHTFVPINEGARKTFANIETFNLLFRGCRLVTPPDENLASFLVSELLALRIAPTALTYDRLILIFIAAGKHALASAQQQQLADPEFAHAQRQKGLELIDWAFRHFVDMQTVAPTTGSKVEPKKSSSLMLRLGTIEQLALELAKAGDNRCWDVLQTGEDHGDEGVEGWAAKGRWVRQNVEAAWVRGKEKVVDVSEDSQLNTGVGVTSGAPAMAAA